MFASQPGTCLRASKASCLLRSAAAAAAGAGGTCVSASNRCSSSFRPSCSSHTHTHEPAAPQQVHDWLAATLPAGDRVGIDPWLHTIEAAEKLGKKLAASGKALVPLGQNPVDAAWGAARPAAPDVSVLVAGSGVKLAAAVLVIPLVAWYPGGLKGRNSA